LVLARTRRITAQDTSEIEVDAKVLLAERTGAAIGVGLAGLRAKAARRRIAGKAIVRRAIGVDVAGGSDEVPTQWSSVARVELARVRRTEPTGKAAVTGSVCARGSVTIGFRTVDRSTALGRSTIDEA